MNKLLENKYLVSALIAVVVFQITYGFLTLDPTNINWLMSAYHDWGTHYLGWAFYRNDPWGFPLTEMNSYYYPIGTNVGFTDTIPLLALFFKIFSGILPEDFQFYGIWFLVCYFLVAFYSMKILNLYKVKPVFVFLGVFLITANPVLAFRGMHPSLCAHWLLLASIYNYLVKSDTQNALRINKNQIILFVLSATINPYLAAMLAGFSIIVPFKHFFYEKTISLKQFIFFPIIAFTLGIAVWLIFGLIVFNNNTNLDVGNIYGLYAFNLNSFFNSFGHYSKFIPDLGMVTENQHEGFGYLGIGLILLSGIAIAYVLIFKRSIFKTQKKLLPLVILSFFLFAFAVSNQVSFGNEVIFKYETLGVVEKLGNIFRAIGRFIWVVYYLIILFSIVIFSKIRLNYFFKLILLLSIFALQFYDIENILTSRDLKGGQFHTKLQDDKWIKLFKEFDEIVSYPPYTNNLVYGMDYQDLSFLALKAKKPITNGYAARENLNDLKRFKDTLANTLKRGEISKGRIYVTNSANLKDFNVLFYKDKVNLKRLDNFYLIYSKEKVINNFLTESKADVKSVDSVKSTFMKNNNFRVIQNNWKTKENLQFNVESYTFEDDVMQISGWAFNKSSENSVKDSIFIALSGKDKSYLFPVNKVVRGDISKEYKRNDLDESGFFTTIFTDKLPKDDYALIIVIKDKDGNFHVSKTDKLSQVGKKKYQTPTIIEQTPQDAPILSNLEIINKKSNVVKMSGWAALENIDSKNSKIRIVLLSKSKKYGFDTELVMRNDVTTSHKNKVNYDYSGFEFKFLSNQLPKGTYQIGVIIEKKDSGKSFYHQFEKTITL